METVIGRSKELKKRRKENKKRQEVGSRRKREEEAVQVDGGRFGMR